jgi:hypothetical protein
MAAAGFASREHSAELSKALDILSRLPHAQLISEETKTEWLRRVISIEPERLAWHAARAGGFGSSEVGTLVRGYRGEYDFFSSPREIVAGKLLIAAPDGGDGNTRRGIIMEPVIRDEFRAKYNAIPRDDIVQAMAKVRGTPTKPWLVGNPDDVVGIPTPDPERPGHFVSKLYMVDYKAPNEKTFKDTAAKDRVKFDYQCQLHHLKMVAEEAQKYCEEPFVLSGLLLVSLDYSRFDLDVRDIQYDPTLDADLITACNHYWWDFLQRGMLPPIEKPQQFKPERLPDGAMDILEALSLEFLAAKQIVEAGEIAMEEAKQKILRVTANEVFDGTKLILPGTVLSATRKVDRGEVLSMCARFGIPIDAKAIEADESAALADLIEAIAAAGYDTSRCTKEKQNVIQTRSHSGPHVELLAREREEAVKRLDSFLLEAAKRGIPDLTLDPLEAKAAKKTKKDAKAVAKAATVENPTQPAESPGDQVTKEADPAAPAPVIPQAPSRARSIFARP